MYFSPNQPTRKMKMKIRRVKKKMRETVKSANWRVEENQNNHCAWSMDDVMRTNIWSQCHVRRWKVCCETRENVTCVGVLFTLFPSVAVRLEDVSKFSEEPEVQGLRHRWLDHVLPQQVPSLMLAAQEVYHGHFHIHACLVHEPDVLGFRSAMAKVTCLFGWSGRSRDLVVGLYARFVKSNTICPIAEYSAGEENKPKDRHVILYPWGSSSIVVPNFLIWRSEKKSTSPVSSTSTMVEHGGVVGKWIMQLSKKVSVTEFAKTRDLLQRQNSLVKTIIPRMFLASFYCWSRSNRSCAAQILNHVCRMVGKIQRGPRHPSNMSFRAIPPSSWSPRIIRPLTGRPEIRFPGMTTSFFKCFKGWKSGLRMSFFLALSFLVLSFACVVDIILACTFIGLVRAKTSLLIASIAFWQAFLALASFVPSIKVFFWWHFRILCLFFFAKGCSSASFGCTFVLSLSLSFPSFHVATLEWSGLPGNLSVVPCPETWSFIINVALLASHFILGPLSQVVFSIVFHYESSVHAADVSAHAEWRISMELFGVRT